MSNIAVKPLYEVKKKYNVFNQEFIVNSMIISNAYNESGAMHDAPFYNITLIPQIVDVFMCESDIIGNNFMYFKPTYMNTATLGYYSKNVEKKDDPRYKIWTDMIYRCYRPKENTYKFFGGSGIKVCDKWKVFKYFLWDWNLIKNIEIMVPRKAYVLQLYNNCYEYNLDTCYLASYWDSDVAKYVGMAKFENRPVTSSPLQPQEHAIPSTNRMLMLNGEYKEEETYKPTQSDYDAMLRNTSFMNQYPTPGSGTVRVLNQVIPEHGPLLPVNSNKPKKEKGKIMCTIVDKKDKK